MISNPNVFDPDFDDLADSSPPVDPTDPLIATFTDLDLAPARARLATVGTDDRYWLE